MKLLVLDNYDSFTYNVVHLMRELGAADITVKRNDEISLDAVNDFDRIVLSPGPGIPNEAGIMPALVKRYGPSKPILGVCLGHQCIGEVYGAELKNLGRPVHGKSTPIEITDLNDPILRGLPKTVNVGRYHSWVVNTERFPTSEMVITAVDETGEIMALRHKQYKVYGVQFHPESVLTDQGKIIGKNFLQLN